MSPRRVFKKGDTVRYERTRHNYKVKQDEINGDVWLRSLEGEPEITVRAEECILLEPAHETEIPFEPLKREPLTLHIPIPEIDDAEIQTLYAVNWALNWKLRENQQARVRILEWMLKREMQG